ncbi:MAG: CBS domain-containing protein [Candidatus Manganitrophaceae bacterium]|nr:MAG: CBS domain-containing protein [Candidatus Manganitrophaceae bacterium]
MKAAFGTVGDIKKRGLFVGENSSAFDVAMELLHSSETGMPVLDRKGRVIGIVSEADLLRAARGPRRLEEVRVKEIMAHPPIVIEKETSLSDASRIMEDAQVHRLPVVEEGIFVGTVTRHDLLRAWLGIGVDMM